MKGKRKEINHYDKEKLIRKEKINCIKNNSERAVQILDTSVNLYEFHPNSRSIKSNNLSGVCVFGGVGVCVDSSIEKLRREPNKKKSGQLLLPQ